jgi:acyl dehydratase
MNQRHFEDVELGDEIGPLIKQPTRDEVRTFAELSHLSGRFTSEEGARDEGTDRMIVSSWQSMGYLAQLITNWMGQEGLLSKLRVSFHRVVEPGQPLECRAVVTDMMSLEGRHIVMLDIFMENREGERLSQGTAEVVLLSNA